MGFDASVGGSPFAVRFEMDVTLEATGIRSQLDEVALCTVQNGKIVQEESCTWRIDVRWDRPAGPDTRNENARDESSSRASSHGH